MRLRNAFLADHGAPQDELDSTGRTSIAIADRLPVDQVVDLLTKLLPDGGLKPNIPSVRLRGRALYDYQCDRQFELLVRAGTTHRCPSCDGEQLERLISSFGVSTSTTRGQSLSAIRETNAGKAREAARAEHGPDRKHRHPWTESAAVSGRRELRHPRRDGTTRMAFDRWSSWDGWPCWCRGRASMLLYHGVLGGRAAVRRWCLVTPSAVVVIRPPCVRPKQTRGTGQPQKESQA